MCIRDRGDTVVLKSDPYGTLMQMRPDNASVIYNIEKRYKWQDASWMSQRKKPAKKEKPEFVYELHLAGFMRPDAVIETDEDGNETIVKPAGFYNYRELAEKVTDYVTCLLYTSRCV